MSAAILSQLHDKLRLPNRHLILGVRVGAGLGSKMVPVTIEMWLGDPFQFHTHVLPILHYKYRLSSLAILRKSLRKMTSGIVITQ